MIPILIPKIWELTKNNKKQKVAKSLVKFSSLATYIKNKKTKLQIEDEEVFTINECGSGELVGYGF